MLTKRILPPCCDRPTIPNSIRDGRCPKCRKEGERRDTVAKNYVRGKRADWGSVRRTRNKLLVASDWTQLPDASKRLGPAKLKLWREYRQKLADIPADFDDPDNIIWPEPPTP